MLKKSREVSLSNGRGEKRDGKLEKRGGHSHNEVGRRTGIFAGKLGELQDKEEQWANTQS